MMNIFKVRCIAGRYTYYLDNNSYNDYYALDHIDNIGTWSPVSQGTWASLNTPEYSWYRLNDSEAIELLNKYPFPNKDINEQPSSAPKELTREQEQKHFHNELQSLIARFTAEYDKMTVGDIISALVFEQHHLCRLMEDKWDNEREDKEQ